MIAIGAFQYISNIIDNFVILIKQWEEISIEEAMKSPEHRIQIDNVVVHPDFTVSSLRFYCDKLKMF